MGTPGWVTIVQPRTASFEQQDGRATQEWQERFADELIAQEQSGATPTLAVELERHRCTTTNWEWEESQAEQRAQAHADRLGQPVLWQFDAWCAWATVQPAQATHIGLARVACSLERLELPEAAVEALGALLAATEITTAGAAVQIARGIAGALGGKRLVVARED